MSTQSYRQAEGGRINRNKPISFKFAGTYYHGYEGDTLASALLANGIKVVGRSFKFHRPRGIYTAGIEEPNAFLTIGEGGYEEVNARATMQPLYDGLVAKGQNCWPGIDFDIGRITDFLYPLFPAGFYNKTFKWPNWHWYEGMIRRAAGLGHLAKEDDPDSYLHMNEYCDVLVMGAGPAGIQAALAAAKTGARVILVEQDVEMGGTLLWQDFDIDGKPGAIWLEEARARLDDADNVTVLCRATASAWFDHNYVVVNQRCGEQVGERDNPLRERLWKIRAGQFILATGAHEQPLVFPDNDRPGIMQASAIRHYLNRYAVVAGKKIVLATNNDSAYLTALDLHRAGVNIRCLVDTRENPASDVVNKVRAAGITVFQHAVISDTRGFDRLCAIKISGIEEDKQTPSVMATIQCDCLGVSGGWQPVVHLLSQARGQLTYSKTINGFVPGDIPDNFQVVGAANGHYADSEQHESDADRVLIQAKRAKQWIDLQHDVTYQDINIAVAENYISVEHMKRYTTTGMSIDQGKTSHLNALSALAERTGKDPGVVGTTTFRPFYSPVTMATLAGQGLGDFYAPHFRTPMYESHRALNARFDEYGPWSRPACYPRTSETTEQAIHREVLKTRQAVAMFDGSPLGKIEVRGEDAAIFLNRIYVNNVMTLRPGKARYTLTTNENGIIIDDGILCCLADNHYLVHTSSAGASRIFSWMEAWLQGDWPDLDVVLTQVTAQWANMAISGPESRMLLEKLNIGIDLSDDAFPYMSIRAVRFQGIPLRIMRSSFTGENGYEINIPADYGLSLWEGLMETGKNLGITPIGVESLTVLRAEKGYLHVGTDTDGTTTPLDLGWGPMIEKKQGFFIGKRSLSRPTQQGENRMNLVGIELEEGSQEISVGAHVVSEDFIQPPTPTQGYVTSACFSPTLDGYIALGLIENGRQRMGERVKIFNNGDTQSARIIEPLRYDPDGEKLNA